METFRHAEKSFCCHGCLTVFELLSENGLTDFYNLADTAGVRVKASSRADQFRYLDEPSVRERIVNFHDAKTTRVTFRIPAIHCVACVWLLENLFRLKPGIGQSQVNFARKEVVITFDTAAVKLSEVVTLLSSLGYEPELKFSDLEKPKHDPAARRLWLQLGYAGFAFGNLMLFSIATYFGLDAFSGPAFRKLVGYISLVVALPVVTYSALFYWRTAWATLRQKCLAIEVPIAAGIVAIFAQSTYEVLSGAGEGYFDSLCGLIFFLLCGRLFQQKTYDRLSFERDYKSFFPLSVTRLTAAGEEEPASLSQVSVGDRLVIRNGELIPADAKLVSGAALIDYSFVTGESEPVEKQVDDHLYAGGRQMGGAIEVATVKAVSQSYLTSLWNQDAFRKNKAESFQTLINVFSYRFTKLVILIALGAAGYWMFHGDTARAFKAFTSVLIVACPCALALASPFALGTAIRALGRRNIFVKSPEVVEAMAQVNSVVFDKTGTLTGAGAGSISFDGRTLSPDEARSIAAVTRQSTHPLSVRISESLRDEDTLNVRSFAEKPGCGIEGVVGAREILVGSAPWLQSLGVAVPARDQAGSVVHVAINGSHRGAFVLTSALRPEVDHLIPQLRGSYELALLSGDNERERERFAELFGTAGQVQFNQSPLSKLEFIHTRQAAGKTVMMVGDGLNDSGALKQSDVGVAVVESISAFSPSSDIIMSARMLPQLGEALRFSRNAVRVVRAAFIISSLYNVVGISIAAAGLLAPVVCAILMPLSSVTVVVFASGMTMWAARRLKNPESTSVTASGDTEPVFNPQLATQPT